MPLSKKQREQIYFKYDGHCAYCGKQIDYKDMKVDHLIPLLRTSSNADWKREHWYGSTDDPNSMHNLMPSCRSCNYRKGSEPLDVFRIELEHGIECCRRDFTYRMMVRYGLVVEQPHKVQFYFEQLEEE